MRITLGGGDASACAPGCLVPDRQPSELARGCLDLENDVANDVKSGTEKAQAEENWA